MTITVDAKLGQHVICATVGRNSSIILPSIKLLNANPRDVKKDLVLIIIPKNREELFSRLLLAGHLNMYQKIG